MNNDSSITGRATGPIPKVLAKSIDRLVDLAERVIGGPV